MGGYHNIYLQWTVTIASTYNERLPLLLLTMNGYHSICLQWMVTITTTQNGRFPQHLLIMKGYQQHLLTMDGYHNINLHATVTISYIYNGWLPKHKLTMNVTITLYFPFHTKSSFYSFLRVMSCTILFSSSTGFC